MGSDFRFEAGEDGRDKFVRSATAALFERAGQTQLIGAAARDPQFGPRFRGLEDGGGLAGFTLLELARECLHRSGVRTRGVNGLKLVESALAYRSVQGTSDFGTILENLIGKSFLGAYVSAPTTWRRWCGIKSLKDFRAAGFYRSGSFGDLPKVSEHGEVPNLVVADGAKRSLGAADTRAGIIGLSRQMIINDDMQTFVALASALGEAATRSIESAVLALLGANGGLGPTQAADGQPLFSATRSNIGPAGAMSVAVWDGAAAVLAAQKDLSSSLPLGLEPAVWLGPTSLRGAAKVINRSAADPSAVAAGVGLVREVVGTPRLSGTRFYFFADPGAYPTFGVGFLEGREDPVIDERESRRSEGVEWRVSLDFATGVLDHRPAVTCAGA